MDSYELGLLLGKLLSYITLIITIWLIFKLISFLKNRFIVTIMSNSAKETIKTYLFWSDFINGIKTIEDFKKKLKKIKNTKVYYGHDHKIYLTKEEAQSKNINTKAKTVRELLKSKSDYMFLLERLERITLYSKEDLKNIDKDCQIVWLKAFDILVHMVLKNNKFIYPLSYHEDNQFRYGYVIVYNTQGLQSVYDIDNESLLFPFEYKHIKLLANLVELSKDEKHYKIIDLQTMEIISTSDEKIFPNIPNELKERINLSKIELTDYIDIVKTPKNHTDLMDIGLWNAKVGVVEVPKHYNEVIKDSSRGTISWEYPIFDLNKELPIMFEKKNGDHIIIGIAPKYLVLESKYRDKLKDVKIYTQEKKGFEGMKKTFKELFNQDLTDKDIDYEKTGLIGDEAVPLGKFIWKDSDCIEYYVHWLPHYRGDSHGYIYKDGKHEHLPTLPQVGKVTQSEIDLRDELTKKGFF